MRLGLGLAEECYCLGSGRRSVLTMTAALVVKKFYRSLPSNLRGVERPLKVFVSKHLVRNGDDSRRVNLKSRY